MPNENKVSFSDRVWFTMKARIRTSDRLLDNHLHSQFLLVWYTLVSCCLSIILLKYPHFMGNDSDVIMTILSVIILVISLVITNLNFKDRGTEIKKHHIKLLEFYEKTKKIEEKDINDDLREEYSTILNEVDNHKSIDDLFARMKNIDGLTSRIPTCFEKCIYYCYRIIRFILLTFSYLLPFSFFIKA